MTTATALSPTAVHYLRTWTLPYGTTFRVSDRSQWTQREVQAHYSTDGLDVESIMGDPYRSRGATGDLLDAMVNGLTVRSGEQHYGDDWDAAQVQRGKVGQTTTIDGGTQTLGSLTIGTLTGATAFRIGSTGSVTRQPLWSHTVLWSGRKRTARATTAATAKRTAPTVLVRCDAGPDGKGGKVERATQCNDCRPCRNRNRTAPVLTAAERAQGKRTAAATQL